MKIISEALVIFGCILLTSLFVVGVESREAFMYMSSVALSSVVMGGIGLQYIKSRYNG